MISEMELTKAEREIINGIGRDRKLLRIQGGVNASLCGPRLETESPVDGAAAARLITNNCLRKLTPKRNDCISGFTELGFPDDGSEWYCLIQ
jgi:hypothetical protein